MAFKSLFLSILFFSVASFSAPLKYNYKDYWTKENVTASNKAKFQLYTKNSPIKGINNIAIMTVADLKNDSFDSILTSVKKAFGSNVKWTTDKVDGLEVHETYDVGTSSLYRLAYNKKTNNFSFGSVKLRFLIPSYVELHLMQVEALTKTKSKKTAQFLYDALFAKAYAGGYAAKASNYLSGIGADALAPTNDAINGYSASFDKGTTKVQAGFDNLKDGVNDLKDEIHDFGSKKSVAGLAAIATISSGATAILTTFVLTTGYKLGKSFLYTLLGKFTDDEKEAKIKVFTDSLQKLEKLEPTIVKMQEQLELVSHSFAALSTESTEKNMRALEKDIENKTREITEGRAQCEECARSELATAIQQLEDLRKVNAAAGAVNAEKKVEICKSVDTLFSKWRSAENEVSTAQASVIKDVRVFMGLVSDNAQIENKMREDAMQNDACESGPSKRLAAISQSDKDTCDKNKDTTNGVCSDLFSFRLQLKSCVNAAKNGDPESLAFLQRNMNRSASELNAYLSVFSTELRNVYCTVEDVAKGACVSPGGITQVSTAFKARFKDYAKQCPNRIFAKTLNLAENLDAPPAKNSESKSLFERMFSSPSPGKTAERASTTYLSGGDNR
jgi:archaellum component FlaC